MDNLSEQNQDNSGEKYPEYFGRKIANLLCTKEGNEVSQLIPDDGYMLARALMHLLDLDLDRLYVIEDAGKPSSGTVVLHYGSGFLTQNGFSKNLDALVHNLDYSVQNPVLRRFNRRLDNFEYCGNKVWRLMGFLRGNLTALL